MHVPLLQQQPSQLAHRDTHTHMMIGPPSLPFFFSAYSSYALCVNFFFYDLLNPRLLSSAYRCMKRMKRSH